MEMYSWVVESPNCNLKAIARYVYFTGCGEVQFGMLHVSLPHPPVDKVGLLALLRGLLTCGREDLLTCVLHSPCQVTAVLYVLPYTL